MTKLIILIVLFISTCILVQGTVQQPNDFVCNCCDQCEPRSSATEEKVLSNISNLLDLIVNSDLVANTTSNPPTTSNTATTSSPSTNTNPETSSSSVITSNPSRTSNPTAASNPATISNPTTTSNPTKISSPATTITNPETTTATNPSTTDTVTKVYACPENCYLDITGQYCNCYEPTVVEVVEEVKDLGSVQPLKTNV